MHDLEYGRPRDLAEATAFLADRGPETALIAGGTDLMIAMREGKLAAACLLDVSRLDEIHEIREDGDFLVIGAGVTFADIIKSPLVDRFAPSLRDAARTVGSAPIRNRATIGGNAANACPAADSLPPLLAHDARVILADAGPGRTLPLSEFITGPYRTCRKPEEMIRGFVLDKAAPEARSAFRKIGRRREMAVSRINGAAVAVLDGEGRLSGVRLAVGSATPVPMRMTEAEAMLEGQVYSPELAWDAGAAVARRMIAQSGIRPSTVYKEPAVQGLVYRVLSGLVAS